jgi:trk system potassium uptake protein TrkH
MSGVTSGSGRVGGSAALVALRARPTAILELTGNLAPVVAGVFAPPLVAALAERHWPLAIALAGPVALGLAALPLRRAPSHDLRRIEALVTVAIVFLVVSLLAAPAFMALGMAPLDALFEAVSGFTATGMSVASDAQAWPEAGHVLRAWLQWCGGLAFVTSALALLIGPGVVSRRLGEAGTEVGADIGKRHDALSSTRTRAREVLIVYLALTVAVGVPAALLASSPWDGFLLTLTTVSTGGFSPAADSLASEGWALQWLLMIGSLVGAMSFGLLMAARRSGVAVLLRDPATQLLVGVVVLISLIACAAVGFDATRSADAILTTLSAVSTGGLSTTDVSALPAVSLIALTAGMAIGGDAGSTAGGLKAARVAMAASVARMMLLRAQAAPGAVMAPRTMGHHFGPGEIAGLAALATLYIGAAFLLWMLCVAYGAAPLPALFDTVSALSTVGLSAGVAGPQAADAVKAGLIVAMLLGRVEFFALILLLRPATWAPRA